METIPDIQPSSLHIAKVDPKIWTKIPYLGKANQQLMNHLRKNDIPSQDSFIQKFSDVFQRHDISGSIGLHLTHRHSSHKEGQV